MKTALLTVCSHVLRLNEGKRKRRRCETVDRDNERREGDASEMPSYHHCHSVTPRLYQPVFDGVLRGKRLAVSVCSPC
jgi:hypothetical protein